MKKISVFVLLAIFFTLNLGAIDFSLSAGAGPFAGGLFTRYTLKADGISIKIDAGQEMNQFNFGGLFFFDAAFCELDFYVQRGMNTWSQIFDIAAMQSNKPATGDGWETMIGFSLLGKYPFSLTRQLILFPLIGMEYQICLVQERTQPDGSIYNRSDGLREKDKDGKAYELSSWNSFFVDLGAGIDFALTGKIFLRGELLYSFRLMTIYEKKNLDYLKAMTGDNNPKLGGLTSGPVFRLLIGSRFFSF